MSEKKVSKKDDKKAVKKKDSGKKAKFSLIQKFRETIAELKKVTWPSRKDLVRLEYGGEGAVLFRQGRQGPLVQSVKGVGDLSAFIKDAVERAGGLAGQRFIFPVQERPIPDQHRCLSSLLGQRRQAIASS